MRLIHSEAAIGPIYTLRAICFSSSLFRAHAAKFQFRAKGSKQPWQVTYTHKIRGPQRMSELINKSGPSPMCAYRAYSRARQTLYHKRDRDIIVQKFVHHAALPIDGTFWESEILAWESFHRRDYKLRFSSILAHFILNDLSHCSLLLLQNYELSHWSPSLRSSGRSRVADMWNIWKRAELLQELSHVSCEVLECSKCEP